jgi:sigma-B regulation protein RsbU (phosphoserine phosphatase)
MEYLHTQSDIMYSIVLVDDELPILRALEREINHIKTNPGWNIELFTNGKDCLDYLRNSHHQVFLVISDLRMPIMRGSDLLEEIHETYPEILTMLLTAFTDLPDLYRAVAASIQSLLFKPWEPEVLTHEILKAWDLYRFRIENRRLQQQLKQQLLEASEFQKKLFTSIIPTNERYKLDVFYKPSRSFHVGGDIYQILPQESGELIILLGDVSGHGIKPALVSGIVKTLFQEYLLYEKRNHAESFPMPSLLMEYLNRGLCLMFNESPDIFVSCTIATYIPSTQSLLFSSGGQPPVFIKRSDIIIPFQTNAPALGMFPGIDYEDTFISVRPRDRVHFLNDGIIENKSLEHRFTTERIMNTLQSFYTSSKTYSINDLADHFLRQMNLQDFEDDASMIALDIVEPVKNGKHELLTNQQSQ